MIERKRVRGHNRRLPALIAFGGLLMLGFLWLLARTEPPPIVTPTPTSLVANKTASPKPTNPVANKTATPTLRVINTQPSEPPSVYAIDDETSMVYGFHSKPQNPSVRFIQQAIEYGTGRAVVVNSRGDTLMIADESSLRAIDVGTGTQRWETPLDLRPTLTRTLELPHMQLVLSPSQRIVVVAKLIADGAKSQPLLVVEYFDSGTGRNLGSITTDGRDWSPNMAVTHDDRFVILPLASRVAMIDLETRERRTLPNYGWLPELTTVSGDGQRLLIIDTQRTIHVLDLPSLTEIRSLSLAEYPFLIERQSLMAANQDGNEITVYTTMERKFEHSDDILGTYMTAHYIGKFFTFDTLSGQLVAQADDENIGGYRHPLPIKLHYVLDPTTNLSRGLLIQRPNEINWVTQVGQHNPFYEVAGHKALLSATAGAAFERGEFDRSFVRPSPLPTSPPDPSVTQLPPEGDLLAEIAIESHSGFGEHWQFYANGSYIQGEQAISNTSGMQVMIIDQHFQIDPPCINGTGDFCRRSPDGNWTVEIVNRSAPYMSMLRLPSITLTNSRDNTIIKYSPEDIPYDYAKIVDWKEDGLYLIELKYIDLFNPDYVQLIRIDPFDLEQEPTVLWSEPRGAAGVFDFEAGLFLYTVNSDPINPFELVLYNFNTQTRTILDVGGAIKHDLFAFSPDKKSVAFVHRNDNMPDRLVLYSIERDAWHHFGDFPVFRNYPIQWQADSSHVGFFIDQRTMLASEQPQPVQRLVFNIETGALARTESMIKPYQDYADASQPVQALPPLASQATYVILEQVGPLVMLSQYRYNEREPLTQIPIGTPWDDRQLIIRYP